MAKKSKLDAKLGSWADQANLSRSQPQAQSTLPHRETHLLERSLIERIGLLAKQHEVTHEQLIGYLLTWSLDQVETGKHKLDI